MPSGKPLRTRAQGLCVLFLLHGCALAPQVVRHTDPLSAEEHNQLAAVYEAQGQKEDAALQYKESLRQEKKNVEALMGLGNLAFQKGDWKEAENLYSRVLKIVPHHPGASNNLAMVNLACGRPLERAEALVQDALKQHSSLQPYVLETLSQIRNRQGRSGDAEAALRQALAETPPEDKALRERLEQARRALKPRPPPLSPP